MFGATRAAAPVTRSVDVCTTSAQSLYVLGYRRALAGEPF
jgi:hypothetical protein